MLASSSRHALREAFVGLTRIASSVSVRSTQQLRNASAQAVARNASTFRTTPFAPGPSGPYWTNPNTSFRSPKIRTDHTASYNLRLSKLVSKHSPSVFALCREMKQAGVPPNSLTYDLLLQMCSEAMMHTEAWAIFEDMVAMRIQPESSTFVHLLNAVRYAPISETWDVWHEMHQFGIRPDQLHYELLIRRFVSVGNLEMALQHLDEMGEVGVPATLATVQGVVRLASRLRFPQLALDLATAYDSTSVRRLDAQTWMSILVASSEALFKDGVINAWERIVKSEGITPDEGCCMNVLHTAGRHGNSTLGLEALNVLRKLGVPWEEHHFAPVVEAFCNEGNIREAFGLLSLMRESAVHPVNETAQPIYVTISQDTDKVDEAYGILEDLHKEGKSIDVTAFNALIQACVVLGDLPRALGTYRAAGDLGVTPNVDTYNTLLSACVAVRHRELGDKLLVEMREAKIKPDTRTYERLVVLCLTQPTYEDAFFFLEDMKSANLIPPQSVYEAIIRRCVAVGDTRYKLAVEEMLERGYEMPAKLKTFIANGGEERSEPEKAPRWTRQRTRTAQTTNQHELMERAQEVKAEEEADPTTVRKVLL